MPVLRLFAGGTIHAPQSPGATALVVADDRIAFLGSDDQASSRSARFDEVVDLAGAWVAPAFVDAHVHATASGLALAGLDLSGCVNLTEALDLIDAHARRHPDRPVLGHGWDERGWPEGRPPSREELDRAGSGQPVYVSRVDVHAAAVSSALLAATPGVRSLPGYRESGHLAAQAHGAVREAAFALITPDQRGEAQRVTRARAASQGIGLIQEMAGPQLSSAEDLRDWLRLAEEPGPDVVGYWGELGGAERARELGALGAAGDIFVDGTIGSHTACLRRVYDDADHSGESYVTAAQVRDHVVACTRAGLQAGFHAIGDGAVSTVVAGFEEAAGLVGVEELRACRHRIEHLEMVDALLIPRVAHLGVFASVQPAFDAEWGGVDGMYAQRLGPDRAATMNPFSVLHAAGIALAFGSDSPVTPIDPWATVRAAAHHTVEAYRLPVEVAFAAHTVGGWRAAGRDDAGLLHVGAPATFAVWRTPAPPDPGGYPDVRPGAALPECRRTVVRGQTIWSAGP